MAAKKKTTPQNVTAPEVAPKRRGRPAKAVEAVAPVKPEPMKSAPANSEPKSVLTIDYPMEGEIVTSPVYTFRLTALEPKSVEIALNGGAWSGCREMVGNWWFDWSGYQAGAYSLSARMIDKNGKTVKTKTRSFTVLI